MSVINYPAYFVYNDVVNYSSWEDDCLKKKR
jgi:hypothetical protein